MTTLSWPDAWIPAAFELRIAPNVRSFTSPYSGGTQILDLGGERWRAVLTMPPTTRVDRAATQEAFFDRLAGGVNTVSLWHFKLPTVRGTLNAGPVAWSASKSGAAWPVTKSGAAWPITRGVLVLRNPVAAGENTCLLQSLAGRMVYAGDMVGIRGELKRVLADATANSLGELAISFAPRARNNWPAYYETNITTTKPTAVFRLQGEVPTQWTPGSAAGVSFELIEQTI